MVADATGGPSDRRDRDATRLHLDAVAIWRMLDSLGDDEPEFRSRLVQERFRVRVEAAALWRQLGHRSITDDR